MEGVVGEEDEALGEVDDVERGRLGTDVRDLDPVPGVPCPPKPTRKLGRGVDNIPPDHLRKPLYRHGLVVDVQALPMDPCPRFVGQDEPKRLGIRVLRPGRVALWEDKRGQGLRDVEPTTVEPTAVVTLLPVRRW